jgi:hypothetical protein
MLISKGHAQIMLAQLPVSPDSGRRYPSSALSARADLWRRYDACLQALRQPLYHRRLGKRKPSPAICFAALQDALRLVAAFAFAYGVRQVIISSRSGVADTISMQPRVHGFNWSARDGVSWGTDAVLAADAPICVRIADLMHLAAKAVHLIIDCEPLRLSPLTATFQFAHGTALVVVHEHAARRRTYVAHIV